MCKEYSKLGSSAALGFFSKGGNDEKTIVNMNGTEYSLFVNDLGKTQFFLSPALSATDFVFIIVLAGVLRRGKFPGFLKAPVNDDPRQAPYYIDHDQSPYFNKLFAAMYDLVLCRIPKMGLIAPNPGCSIANVFEEKIPNYGDSAGEERQLVGPGLIAYLQWLLYRAPFKSQDQGARGDEQKYYVTSGVSFKA